MILRNVSTGGVEVYDLSNNQITGAAFMGTVGLTWQFSGVGNFSGLGESDMILRNSNTGGLEVYDINNNQLTGAAFIGTVGLDWQLAGIAAANGAGTSDLVLRNVNTGAFEVYDIANNQLTGAAALVASGETGKEDGRESELKPFVAVQRVRLPPGKGAARQPEASLARVRQRHA